MYSVAIYTSPLPFPMWMFSHTWVVISDGETTHRYDVWGDILLFKPTSRHGYIYRNTYRPHTGIRIWPRRSDKKQAQRFKGKLFKEIRGDEKSLAAEMYTAIITRVSEYPFAHTYHKFGPNCNTFTAWLIQLVPNQELTLPYNAWGKRSISWHIGVSNAKCKLAFVI